MIIFRGLFYNLTTSLICWFLVCPQIWQAYFICATKRAFYTVASNSFEVQHLNFDRGTFVLLSFAFSMLIWDYHVKELYRVRPRHFFYFEICICWPLIQKLSFFVTSLTLVENFFFSVLSTLSDILLALSYWTIDVKSWFIYLLVYFIELLEHKRFGSYDAFQIVEKLYSYCLYIGKKRGSELSLLAYYVYRLSCFNQHHLCVYKIFCWYSTIW